MTLRSSTSFLDHLEHSWILWLVKILREHPAAWGLAQSAKFYTTSSCPGSLIWSSSSRCSSERWFPPLSMNGFLTYVFRSWRRLSSSRTCPSVLDLFRSLPLMPSIIQDEVQQCGGKLFIFSHLRSITYKRQHHQPCRDYPRSGDKSSCKIWQESLPARTWSYLIQKCTPFFYRYRRRAR